MNKRSSAGYLIRLAFLLAAVSLAGCAELTGGFNDTGLQELASVQDVREYQTTFGRMRIGFEGTIAKGVYEYRQGSVHGNLQDNVLSGTWREGAASGSFTFTFSADFTSFQGHWTPGYNEWKGQLIFGRSGPPTSGTVASPTLPPPPSPFHPAMEQEMQGVRDVREYSTTFGRMRIGFEGTTAKGVYEYRQGTVRGSLQGNVLTGVWKEGTAEGAFVFHFSSDFGSFSGTWQPGNKPWTGTLTAGSRGSPGTAVASVRPPASGSSDKKSDVDHVPALRPQTNRNAHAIVIGIEQYRQKLPRADFAVRDARVVSEYLVKVLGYPEENIVTLINEHAAMGDFVKYFEKWLANNVEKDGTVFVYFSGHGAPNPRTGDAYLVPYDGDPSFIEQTGYPLRRLHEALGALPAREVIVTLDSCFSGAGGKSVLAKGARPLVMNLQESLPPSQKIVMLSAAAGDQISSTYEEKSHGLFTYFLLKAIKERAEAGRDVALEIGDLFAEVKPQVERVARKLYNNEQTPQIMNPSGRKTNLR